MTLHLVRHGRPLVDRRQPARAWPLDPAGYDDVWALRERLPARAAWFTSPETRAVETAQLLTDAAVGIVDDLREQVRDTSAAGEQTDVHADVVRRAFDHPDEPAAQGWEPLTICRQRVVAAARPLLAAHRGEDVVLIGHATAWTVLASELTGEPPDLARWAALAHPDVIRLDLR